MFHDLPGDGSVLDLPSKYVPQHILGGWTDVIPWCQSKIWFVVLVQDAGYY